ncbi:hypothetical protein CEK28_16335 [Xenophilus sp. AP218F]|nr:hypothetical protein CEK28_16335 [Xenophilus sp. AP218F]
MGLGERILARCRSASAPARLAQMHRLLPFLALAVIAVWLGQQLSGWLAPASRSYRSLSAPSPQSAAAGVAQAHWFGEPVQQQAAALPPLKLIGVYAPSRPGVAGFAIIDNNGHAEVLLPGKATPDGWELAAIAANGITVRSGGSEQFVPLQARGGGAAPDVPPGQHPPALAPGAPVPAGVPPPPGQLPESLPQPAVDPAAMVRQ